MLCGPVTNLDLVGPRSLDTVCCTLGIWGVTSHSRHEFADLKHVIHRIHLGEWRLNGICLSTSHSPCSGCLYGEWVTALNFNEISPPCFGCRLISLEVSLGMAVRIYLYINVKALKCEVDGIMYSIESLSPSLSSLVPSLEASRIYKIPQRQVNTSFSYYCPFWLGGPSFE